MKKKELRKIYKQKRKDLSTVEVESFQESIYQQVFEFDFLSINTIHVFLSIERLLEINTNPIIDFLLLKNKTIVVSVSDFSTNTLTHYLFDRNTKLKVSSYGIPEPINGIEIDPKEIDLVFVPLLISDEKKYQSWLRKRFLRPFSSRMQNGCKNDWFKLF